LVQVPRSWYHHLQEGFLFGPDLEKIEKVIKELEDLGYGLTREEEDENTAFAFLGVSITPDPITKMLHLTQKGFIKRSLQPLG
jgi:hypothetical protein